MMAKRRVLIADDSKVMRLMIRHTLEGMGHEVVGEAADGRMAVELAAETNPDVITMDIVMPHMNGIQAVQDIIAREPAMVILMISALDQEAMVVQALEAGAKDFIAKPFESADLAAAMTRLLVR